MITGAWLGEAALAALARTYLDAGRVLWLPNAVDEAAARALRTLLEPSLEPFELADRGHYAQIELSDLEIFAPVQALASAVCGEPLRPFHAAALRFLPGDYSLLKDSRGAGEAAVEATLDLSASRHDGAALHYERAGELLAALPQAPLALALVDRRQGAFRYDRYLPRSAGPAEVWRLRILLAPGA